MYRLMKSQQYVLNHPVSGPMSSYRQTDVAHYQQFEEVLKACEVANNKVDNDRHYILNGTGQEYFTDDWID